MHFHEPIQCLRGDWISSIFSFKLIIIIGLNGNKTQVMMRSYFRISISEATGDFSIFLYPFYGGFFPL